MLRKYLRETCCHMLVWPSDGSDHYKINHFIKIAHGDKLRDTILHNIPYTTVFSDNILLQYGKEFSNSQASGTCYQSLINRIYELLSNYSQKVQSQNSPPDMWNMIGHLLFIIGDNKAALSSYLKSIIIFKQKNDIFGLFGIGCIYLLSSNTIPGIKLISKVLNNLPQNLRADSLIRLGVASRKIRNYQESVNYFKSLIQSYNSLIPKEDILLQLAYTYQCAGMHDDAANILTQLSEIFPNNISIFKQNIFTLTQICSKREIKKKIDKFLAISNNDSILNLFIGRLYFNNQNYERSIKHYQKVLPIFSKYSEFWSEIAGVIHFIGNDTKAMEYLQRAITIDQTNQNAWLNIIYLTSRKDINLLEGLCKRAIESVQDKAFEETVSLFSNIPAALHWFPSEFNALSQSPAEEWSNQYLSSAPRLPPWCFGCETDFSELCGTPQPLVSNNGGSPNPPFRLRIPSFPSDAFVPVKVIEKEFSTSRESKFNVE